VIDGDLVEFFDEKLNVRQPWRRDGACRLPEHAGIDMFPDDIAGVRAAQRVCAGCPVAGECLMYALEHRIEFGVWGGTSQRDRLRMSGRLGAPKRPKASSRMEQISVAYKRALERRRSA
jgi:WhiB family redox-sensing transcriptional regulator